MKDAAAWRGSVRHAAFGKGLQKEIFCSPFFFCFPVSTHRRVLGLPAIYEAVVFVVPAVEVAEAVLPEVEFPVSDGDVVVEEVLLPPSR